MNKIIYVALVGLLFWQCSENNQDTQQKEVSIWEENKEYSLEELIILFQGWVPEELLKEEVLWMNNAYWEDYKLTDPKDLECGMRLLSWKNDSVYTTPALYMFYMIGTIDRVPRDSMFFTSNWSEPVEKTNYYGEPYMDVPGSLWLESMSVNYSEEKCARMLLTFVNEYLNSDEMKPEWMKEKERWIKEMELFHDRVEVDLI